MAVSVSRCSSPRIRLLASKTFSPIAMGENVLDASKRILGDEHLDTLTAMSNFSVILRMQGKLDQAAAMGENVLDASKRILGDEHPDTLTAMSNFSVILRMQGKLDQA